MSRPRRLAPLVCLALLALGVGCARARRAPPRGVAPGAEMGVYRVRVETSAGESSRFRLLLFAAAPDRLHGEIVSAVGTTEVIVDGGGGRLAVTVPRKRVAYAGHADADALAKLIGVRLDLAGLVRGLLEGAAPPDGPSVVRQPESRYGLPDLLVIRGEEGSLRLQLKRLRPLRVSTEELGNGRPPAGMEVRPLEELETLRLPDDDRMGGESS